MGVLADYQIARDVKIDDAQEGIKREGKISYGYTSYGYDCRIGYVFDVFSPIHATEIDPKNFDKRALQRIDLTPCHRWGHAIRDNKFTVACDRCFKERSSDGSDSQDICPKVPNFIRVPPHSFVLGESIETFHIPRDVLCIVLGKSTYARCGLIVNVTPGEPEWSGKWTIEISNTTDLPARIYAGEGIMQCIFLRTDGRRESIENVLKCVTDTEQLANLSRDIQAFHNGQYYNSCKVSYADKKGKYQNQTGLTMPTVDKHSEHPEGK